MKRDYEIWIVSLALSLTVLAVWLNNGCGWGDEDFSDTKIIEQLIKEDIQQIFGVSVADDEEVSPSDTTVKVLTKVLRFPPDLVHYGRVVRQEFDTISISFRKDTAFAVVTYRLEGDFRVVLPDGDTVKKAISHPIHRFVTFVRRKDLTTGARWSRLATSAAFGLADNSQLGLDTIYIQTPRDTIFTTNPFKILQNEDRHITLLRGDVINITIAARNNAAPQDTLFANVVLGRNIERDGRIRLRLPYVNGRYSRNFLITEFQPIGFNQLMIDFIARGRSFSPDPNKPYDSFLLIIPYRVE